MKEEFRPVPHPQLKIVNFCFVQKLLSKVWGLQVCKSWSTDNEFLVAAKELSETKITNWFYLSQLSMKEDMDPYSDNKKWRSLTLN